MPSARYHLFYTLVCTPKTHGKALWLIDRLVTMLPHIATCIRDLTLHGALEVNLCKLRAALDVMKNLDTISLGHKTALVDDDSMPRGPPGIRIRVVTIMTCDIPCTALLNFLSLFSSIVCLNLCNIHPYGRPARSGLWVSPMLSQLVIRELCIMPTPIAFIHEVVRRTRAAGAVTKFVLTACAATWEEVDELGEVLMRMRSTLWLLAVLPLITNNLDQVQQSDSACLSTFSSDNSTDSRGTGPLWERLNLSRCSLLDTLNLTIYNKDPAYILPLLAAYLAAVMSAPSSLRMLNIFLVALPQSYDPPFAPAYMRAFWDERDEMVVKHCPRRMTVNLDLVPMPASSAQTTEAEREVFKTFITKHCLPRSVKQGRLRVLEDSETTGKSLSASSLVVNYRLTRSSGT